VDIGSPGSDPGTRKISSVEPLVVLVFNFHFGHVLVAAWNASGQNVRYGLAGNINSQSFEPVKILAARSDVGQVDGLLLCASLRRQIVAHFRNGRCDVLLKC
jgi:hypothetical protein